jgi:tRNA (mo5U34)-methyltransferase
VLRSKAQRKLINIYDVSPETVGTYDLVFCGSVLPHLTDPIKALWRIQSVTKEMAIVATCISRDNSTVPRAVFAGQHDGTSWWLPNRACLEAMVQVAAFKCWEWFSEFRLDFRDGRPGVDHSVIRAWNSSRETVGIEDKEDTEVESVKGRRPGRLQKWRRKLGITA